MREATIHIPHKEFEKVGLGEFVTLVRAAGLRDITELACESEGCLVVITVDAPVNEVALDSIARLAWWERLSAGEDKAVYLCKITFPSFDGDVQPLYNPDVSNEQIQVDEGGIDIDLVGAQDVIAKEINEYDSVGMSVLLQRISDYGGPRRTLDSLTERQREILKTAYDMGYFDVPRSVSTADVAEELQLDSSTVAEHLQRAERNLVGNLLTTP